MASTSLIFILWNASSTQAMMIIAVATMPVTVVTAPLDSVVARLAMVARHPDGRNPGPTPRSSLADAHPYRGSIGSTLTICAARFEL